MVPRKKISALCATPQKVHVTLLVVTVRCSHHPELDPQLIDLNLAYYLFFFSA